MKIKLKPRDIEGINKWIHNITEHGRNGCPFPWDAVMSGCRICRTMFPDISMDDCPCGPYDVSKVMVEARKALEKGWVGHE